MAKVLISLPDDLLQRIDREALAGVGRFESANLIREQRRKRDAGDRRR